jgi:Domain of unknown function (DUF4403)
MSRRIICNGFRAAGLAAGLLIAASCGSSSTPAAAGPPPQPASVLGGPSEVSTLVVPVNASLAPLLPQLESQVPKSFVNSGDYEMEPQGRFGLKYKLLRDPIALNMQGIGLHVTTKVKYALEGCTRTRSAIVTGEYRMWPCISCGFGEPMRESLIYLDTYLDWDENWRLRSRTKARPVDFPNRCGITFFKLDITEWKLAPLINQQLQDVARTIDRQTPKLTSIRADAQKVWASLQEPVEVAPHVWLLLEPQDFGVTPISGNGLNVTSTLVLRATTRIVVGAKPAPSAKPLPPLHTTPGVGDGFRVAAQVELPYTEAGRLLTEQFARTYKVNGRDLVLRKLALQPGPNGRIEVDADIDYRGGRLRSYSGLIHLEGQPVYDAATATLSITSLDYSLDPKRRNPFLKTADRLAHDTVRSSLAANAKWNVAQQVGAVRGEIEKGLNRTIAPMATLHGQVTSVQPTGIVLGPNAIVINVVAVGTARIDVK